MMNGLNYDGLADLPREQRWRNQVYPAPIVVALIRRQLQRAHTAESDEHLLLIHRNQNPYKGKWAVGWFTYAQIDGLHESGTIIPSDRAMIRGFAGANDVVPYLEAEKSIPIEQESDDTLRLNRFERIEGHK